MDYIKIDLKQI